MTLKKTGRSYLRDTQPEVWKIAYDMSSILAAELADKKWRERAFVVDGFVADLMTEMLGPDGLMELACRPIAELLPEGDESSEEVAQIVASVRAILTAALLDLPEKDPALGEEITSPEHALLLLLSELTDFQNAGRNWAAMNGVETVVDALKPLAALATLLIADRSAGNTIEAIAPTERLKAMVQDFLGDQATIH
ncbi:MAG: hypothetical protein EP347_06440 [Alphaproteobacteria bacterium]|nr:MAG: hypothetical protein EP347_06440 [Alphaproteobacteria bacterium]